MRKTYLDNIRWSTVVLVVVYHVFYLFNACGVPGGVGPFAEVQPQDAILPLVYPWFMVLLFAVAGMSARYSLEKRSGKDFLKSRTIKLLIPSTLGLFVFQWLVGWLNVTIGGGLTYMTQVPKMVLYLIFAVSGIGPLWFAQMLWLFSLLLVLVRKLDKKDKLHAFCEKAHPLVLLPLGFLLWCGAQVGNVPVLTFYRFGIYGVAFFGGYFILSLEKIQEALGRFRWVLLTASLALALLFVSRWYGKDYTAPGCLQSPLANLYAWCATLAVLGTFKIWIDKETGFTRYMSRASWGIYVLHYFFALITCWGLKTYTSLPVAAIYALAIIVALLGSVGCWELFRRIPFVRFAVLGIRKKI